MTTLNMGWAHGPEPMNTQELIQQLLAPERASQLDTFTILSLSEINLHDTVADIGCGPGFFTVPLAKYLVNGKVYALDVDDQMLAACREQVDKARMGNVEVMKCDKFSFPLQRASLDGAFLAFVVHMLSERGRFLGAVGELLHPGAWCTILEFHKKESDTGCHSKHRVEPQELENLARDAGFRSLGWRDLNGDHYMMTLRRL